MGEEHSIALSVTVLAHALNVTEMVTVNNVKAVVISTVKTVTIIMGSALDAKEKGK